MIEANQYRMEVLGREVELGVVAFVERGGGNFRTREEQLFVSWKTEHPS
jgi:hypothetical protein